MVQVEKRYTHAVRTSFARGALLLALITLTHCGGNDATPVETTGARNALFWMLQVQRSNDTPPAHPRPGAALGTYVASFLAHSPGTLFKSALQGIESQLQLLFREDSTYSDSFQILEQLGTILEVDVRDMLNRSTNRTQSLDAYFQSLTSALQRGTTHRDQLDLRTNQLNGERRAKRKIASDIQHILNTALRAGDYATASEKQCWSRKIGDLG